MNASCLAILGGIILLWTNIREKHIKYYLGEGLTEMSVTVEESPEYYSRKHSESRYNFKAVQYPCELWLSAGALDMIKDNEDLKKQIEKITPGDSLTIEIRTNDKSLLEQSSGTVRVMGLKNKTATLIQAQKVEKADRKWFIIAITSGILMLIAGILIFLYHWKKTP